MAQKEIEVILTRQLASYLAMPIIIVDSSRTLLGAMAIFWEVKE